MDEFRICPFNTSHKVLKSRMPSHIVKCKPHYKGEPLEQCPYNAQHFIKIGTLREHLKSCQDRELACYEG